MQVRRVVSRTPLGALVPVFAAIRADVGVSGTYAADVLAEAAAADTEAEAPHVVGERHDATHLPLVTIDPEGARDLDQAVHLESSPQGQRIFYAIADVGAHVVPGGALDRDTRERVETIYCPDKRVGLHPPLMSEGFASLLPGQRTKAVLWTLDVDRDGNLTGFDARRAWVRSRRQYAYPELATSPPAEARDLVTALHEFGQARRAALRKLGAVTLPRPSQEAVVEDGKVSLEFRASLDVEDDNAQVSLLTGMAAARCMLDAGVGILRTMPAASPEALQRLRRQAAALGMEWPDAWTYADMLDHLDPGAPRTAAFLTEAGALFRGARWEAFDSARGGPLALPANTTHGALAAPYAHVTAPLRRLVDRYDAEICLAQCAGREVPAWALEALAWIGDVMAAGVGRSQRVDTACVDAVEVAMLAPHVGEIFEGVGLDAQTVQLHEPAVVARCAGSVEPGRRHRVRLVSAQPGKGALFTLVD
ncbi:MAG: RNB domain-containing ribonuclease [bacterium]|nr:RNB domain-containing ribonuclease [bacterium]